MADENLKYFRAFKANRCFESPFSQGLWQHEYLHRCGARCIMHILGFTSEGLF